MRRLAAAGAATTSPAPSARSPMGRARPVRPVADGRLLVGHPHARTARPRCACAATAPRWSRTGVRAGRRVGAGAGRRGRRPARRRHRLRRARGRAIPLVARLAREHRGLRLPATGRVFQRLLRAVLEQKVTGKEAYRAYAATVRHFHQASGGEPAPGPAAAAAACRPTRPRSPPPPYWVFHPFGMEQRRADTLLRAAAVAARLEAAHRRRRGAPRRLTAIPGIGAVDRGRGGPGRFGDPDAVSVGDYHIPHMVAWALAGEARAGARERAPGALSPADRACSSCSSRSRGHRGRVCVLLEHAGLGAPRFGPRHADPLVRRVLTRGSTSRRQGRGLPAKRRCTSLATGPTVRTPVADWEREAASDAARRADARQERARDPDRSPGCATSRSGTASARSSSATATRSSWPAAAARR